MVCVFWAICSQSVTRQLLPGHAVDMEHELPVDGIYAVGSSKMSNMQNYVIL